MDFPNLRKRPTYVTILSALQALEIQPNSWVKISAVEQSAPIDQAAILRFLMSVIASDLEWLRGSVDIHGEILTELDQREILFDLASKRVAERCGRSGEIPLAVWLDLKRGGCPDLNIQGQYADMGFLQQCQK